MTGGTVGLVVPAYQPDISRLREYIEALDTRLSPTTILIELDSPGENTETQLADLHTRRSKRRILHTGTTS